VRYVIELNTVIAWQGVMSGIVGGSGNLGGIIFALIFRFQTAPGKAFWVVGAMCMAINLLLLPVPVPDT
jgi:MFS transporter, NNP family, nitrate/nitrite transporter